MEITTQRKRPEPCKAVIVGRGWTIKAVAAAVGCNSNVLGEVLNRRRTSWPALRARLAQLLELPEDELFADSDASDSAA